MRGTPSLFARWRPLEPQRAAYSLSPTASLLMSACLVLLSGCEAPRAPEHDLRKQSAALLPTGLLTPPSTDPAQVGRWSPHLIEGEVPAVSMALLHDGRVAYWSGIDAVEEHSRDSLEYYMELHFLTGHFHDASTRVLDLSGASPIVTTPAHPTGAREGDLFCSSHTILSDGRVLDVGGTAWTTIGEGFAILAGLNHAQFFDPAVSDWVATGDMHYGRWYPSILSLPDGNAFVASGLYVSSTSTMQTALERFDVGTEQWTYLGDRSLPMYARLTVVPSGPRAGKIFYSTSGQLWGPSGGDPFEATWNLQQSCDWNTGACEYLGPSLFGARQFGISVLLPLSPLDGYEGRILTFGGTLNRSIVATNLAEIAHLNTPIPLNTLAAPMNYPRWQANGVLLPDGTVLAIGGSLYDTVMAWGQPGQYILHAENYDPRTNTWKLMAPMQVARGYHSTALLLPDARVLVGGTATLPFPSRFMREHVPGEEQLIESRFEIYEPPYLFRGPRPVILNAPAQFPYGQTFELEVEYSGPIDSVVLVKPGSTTHALDTEQRVINLAFTELFPGRLEVTAPPDGNVATPGYYMIFVNGRTAQGPVPSVSRMVKLDLGL